jgi:hypothetical protein
MRSMCGGFVVLEFHARRFVLPDQGPSPQAAAGPVSTPRDRVLCVLCVLCVGVYIPRSSQLMISTLRHVMLPHTVTIRTDQVTH